MRYSISGLTMRPAMAAALAGTVLLAGCGSTATATGSSSTSSTTASSTTASSTTPAETTSESSAASAESSPVTISDAWVKATAGEEDTAATAAFGVLHNPTDNDLTVVSATNTASARTELHEMSMVDGAMVMRAIAGGIVVPANGETTLSPGGLHVMILDAPEPIAPGDEVGVTLTMNDGSTLSFLALAKEFSGANEEYEMTGEMMDTSDGSGMTGATGMDTGAMDTAAMATS